jgi:hypothetical protein
MPHQRATQLQEAALGEAAEARTCESGSAGWQ